LEGGCNDYAGAGTTIAVGSSLGCQSPDPLYAGVFDLSGNVSEWEDSCNGSGATAKCQGRGWYYYLPGDFLYGPGYCADNNSATERSGFDPRRGFRCCSDGPVADDRMPQAISAGQVQTCVLLKGGSIRCWGCNDNGELGNGNTTRSSIPVTVSGITDATAIASAGNHTCVIVTGGTVKCWGLNSRGQLGNGTTTNSPLPVAVQDITGAVAIALGEGHSCAKLAGGTVKCWGWNGYGQLGTGTPGEDSPVPVSVLDIDNASAIAATDAYHTCALLDDGTIRCWGYDAQGQLGDGTITMAKGTPVKVSGISDAVAIAVASSTSCAKSIDGSVWCWGYNGYWTLGNNTVGDSAVPVKVLNVANPVGLFAGGGDVCVTDIDGSLRCWGQNDWGQLGNGSSENTYLPVTVPDISDTRAVAVGGNFNCAISGAGAVRCWGANTCGQLGDGTTVGRQRPVAVVGY
jgi:alpha-tubulin suppressor-like RCC1 family protein